jgi:hypothetical protein
MTKLISWFEKRHWAALTLSFIVGLPVSILSAAKYWPFLDQQFKTYPKISFGLAIFWPFLMTVSTAMVLQFKPAPPTNVRELMRLLECLKQIVGQKVKRFEEFLSRQNDEPPDRIFAEITRPDQQITEIVTGIYRYFQGTVPNEKNDVQIRVALARMGDRYIDGFESYYPSSEKPRSELRALQLEASGFSRAKLSGKILVVESIKKEGRKKSKPRFAITHPSRKDEDGSMICYPVKLKGTNQIPYVISVCASESGYFREAHATVYESILQNFEQRIVLEYCLHQIKGKCSSLKHS